MPIIIHRDDPGTVPDAQLPPDPRQFTASNDWDKAVGAVVMIGGGFLMLQSMAITGELATLIAWIQRIAPLTQEENREFIRILALFLLHTVAMGLLNVFSGWGIWSKKRWVFGVALPVNVAAILVQTIALGDFSPEYLVLTAGVAAYSLLRLCGGIVVQELR